MARSGPASAHEALAEAGAPHAVIGGVAVCLHGYYREHDVVDVDPCLPFTFFVYFLPLPLGEGWGEGAFVAQPKAPSPGLRPASPRGERRDAAGAGKGSEVLLPSPADDDVAVIIEGLPVLSLSALIESKLACGEGDARRMHRDFADVVELIAVHGLDGTFAQHLHKAVRPAFRQLVRRVR